MDQSSRHALADLGEGGPIAGGLHALAAHSMKPNPGHGYSAAAGHFAGESSSGSGSGQSSGAFGDQVEACQFWFRRSQPLPVRST